MVSEVMWPLLPPLTAVARNVHILVLHSEFAAFHTSVDRVEGELTARQFLEQLHSDVAQLVICLERPGRHLDRDVKIETGKLSQRSVDEGDLFGLIGRRTAHEAGEADGIFCEGQQAKVRRRFGAFGGGQQGVDVVRHHTHQLHQRNGEISIQHFTHGLNVFVHAVGEGVSRLDRFEGEGKAVLPFLMKQKQMFLAETNTNFFEKIFLLLNKKFFEQQKNPIGSLNR